MLSGTSAGFYSYMAQEGRTAVEGYPNASRGDLEYAVMIRFDLIGNSKTTSEWEAIVIGGYHPRLRPHC